jgi:hypothetical protein
MPKYPTSSSWKGGRIAQRLLAKTWQFHPFSMKHYVSVNIYKKLQEIRETFKTLSGSSSVLSLSNHTTFSHQIGATVPLTGFHFFTA